MIKGFYAAASAMVVNANRQNTLSHNIANLETPGFKQILNSCHRFQDTAVCILPATCWANSTLITSAIIALGPRWRFHHEFLAGGLKPPATL
jgi:flagellar basal body rod protein FlgF